MDKFLERRVKDARFVKKCCRKLIQKKRKRKPWTKSRKTKLPANISLLSIYANGKKEIGHEINISNFKGFIGGEDIVLYQNFQSDLGKVFLYINMDGHGRVEEEYQKILAVAIEKFVKNDLFLFAVSKKDEEYIKIESEKFSREFHLINDTKGGTTCTITILITNSSGGTHVGMISWGDSSSAIFHLNKNPRMEVIGNANADELASVQEYVNYCRNNGLTSFLPYHNRMNMFPYLATGSKIVDKYGRIIEEFNEAETIISYLCKSLPIEILLEKGYITNITSFLNELRNGKVMPNPVCRFHLNELQKNHPSMGRFGIQGVGSGSVNIDGISWSSYGIANVETISPNIGSAVAGLQTLKSFGDFYHKKYLSSSYVPECLFTFVPNLKKANIVMGSDGLWDVLTFNEVYEEVTCERKNLYQRMLEVMNDEPIMRKYKINDRITHDDLSFMVIEIEPAKVK